MKKTTLAAAVALSFGLSGVLSAAPAFAAPAQEEAEAQGSVSLSTESLTASEYADKGITVTIAGALPDTNYRVLKTGEDGNSEEFNETTDRQGNASVTLGGNGEKITPGTYGVHVDSPDAETGISGTKEFTVTADNEAAELSISDKELPLSEYAERGNELTIKGAQPSTTYRVDISLDGKELTRDTFMTIDTGGAIYVLGGDRKNKPEFAGNYSVTVTNTVTDEILGTVTYTVTDDSDDDAADAKPALKVSEKKISAADFVNDKKGVVLTVSNLNPSNPYSPGDQVKFTVTGTSGNAKSVKPLTKQAGADDEGNAVFSVVGLSESNPEAYVGKYKVEAEVNGETLTGSFEVVSGKPAEDAQDDDSKGGGAKGGGSTSADNAAAASNSLPATGQGLEGIAAGAVLLVVGSAAIVLTRRKHKA